MQHYGSYCSRTAVVYAARSTLVGTRCGQYEHIHRHSASCCGVVAGTRSAGWPLQDGKERLKEDEHKLGLGMGWAYCQGRFSTAPRPRETRRDSPSRTSCALPTPFRTPRRYTSLASYTTPTLLRTSHISEGTVFRRPCTIGAGHGLAPQYCSSIVLLLHIIPMSSHCRAAVLPK